MSYVDAPALRGWRHWKSGTTRELYLPVGYSAYDAESLLVVATDRVMAYHQVFPTQVQGKALVSTQLTLWWLEQLGNLVPNHLITSEVSEQVAGRAMICRRLDMYPVRCVVRGYLSGRALEDYEVDQAVAGQQLPSGLNPGDRLPEPIVTLVPKLKMGRHDRNVSAQDLTRMLGKQKCEKLEAKALEIYQKAHQIALDKGIVLAEAKFEFGSHTPYGGPDLVLADEVFTPDSCRMWDLDQWEENHATSNLVGEHLRAWVESDQCDWIPRCGQPAPELPEELVVKMSNRYQEIYEILTGRTINF